MASLYQTALELAVKSFPDDGSAPMPFAMAKTGDALQHFTIVTTNSHKAMHLGRRIVRESAPDADEYAIVADTFIRVDGERSDALSVEFGNREGGRVIAQRYRKDGAAIITLGEPLDVERRPSALVLVDPNELEWGGITPDFYNSQIKVAVHAMSHRMETSEDAARTVRFLRGRSRRFALALPPGSTQMAFVDNLKKTIDPARIMELARGLDGAMTLDLASDRKKN